MRNWLLRNLLVFVVVINFVGVNAFAVDLPDFSELIEKTSPAVVKITATAKPHVQKGSRQQQFNQQEIPEIFRQFLDQHQQPQRDRGAIGSGFIISGDGYVLTNNHVIDDADEIKIKLNDQREFEAKLIGTDERSDIALLKIEAKNLPVLNLAKTEKLKVGQWVVAIGSPFGLDYSASAGIVSAIGRSIPNERGDNTYVPFIQTDVAINPGNSGGPLFNMQGEVVGINSQIFTPSGGSVGLSFAIPASVALDVVAQLKDKGHVDRGWLGVSISDVDADMAKAYGLDKSQGAMVGEVNPEGPAAKAGVQEGDLIISFNGQPIKASSDLPHIVGAIAPNTKVNFEVIRKGKRQTLSVVVGKLPSKLGQKDNSPVEPAGSAKPTKPDALGLSVVPNEAGSKEKGVQVVSVEPDSAAQRAGLARGDIITQLDFTDVATVNEYNRIVAGLPKNEPKAIRFVRNGQPVFRSIVIK